MKVYNSIGEYDYEEGVASVFLAGPTKRDKSEEEMTPWRVEALEYLKNAQYEGHVYVPEPYLGTNYDQIEWEAYHMNKAKCIMFWVPREMKSYPGLTTNIEFGQWMNSGKVVLGVPPEAVEVEYMIYKAKQFGAPVLASLSQTLDAAMAMSRK